MTGTVDSPSPIDGKAASGKPTHYGTSTAFVAEQIDDLLVGVRPQLSLDEVIDAALAKLSDRQREILTLRSGLLDGKPQTHDQIGTLFGLTRSRIQQIDKKSRDQIARSRSKARPGSLLTVVDTAIHSAGGALSLNSTLHAVGATTQDAIAIARFRFVLSFTDRLVLLKEYPIVVASKHPCKVPEDRLPRLCGMLIKALDTTVRSLSLDELVEIISSLANPIAIAGADCSALVSALLAALPEVLRRDDGTYYLAAAQGNDGHFLPATEKSHTRRKPYKRKTASFERIPDIQQPLDSYDHWNHAIAIDTILGLPLGSIVFMSVDDESLGRIAALASVDVTEPLDDFLTSLRKRVTDNSRVTLTKIQGRNSHGEPNCIAFLAASVLAASRMAVSEDGEITATAYFARLAEVLNLDAEDGRPRGLRTGAEEPLWREWAIWLSEQGLISSAHGGRGSETYKGYPISQALLRAADRDRLRRLFIELRWAIDWDADTLVSRLRKEAPRLSKHVQSLLQEQSSRTPAIANAIADVYDVWLERGESARDSNPHRSRCLYAQILRHEHPISGLVTLYLYPRCPRRLSLDRVDLQVAGVSYSLTAERPSWLLPIIPLDEQQIDHGIRIPIDSPAMLEALVLAQQAFWVLVPDPENQDSGIYASWGKPALGDRFILLCRHDLLPQLQRLRDERLIQWHGDPRFLSSEGRWIELVDCMVISPAWEGVEIADRELHEKLRPSERFSIGLSGGLRMPNGAGWLQDHGPVVTIFGFPPEVDVLINRVADESAVLDGTRPTNQPFSVDWPGPGDYLVAVVSSSQEDTRTSLVKIVAWDDLHIASVQAERMQWLTLGAARLCGALLVEHSEEYEDAPMV